jgi:hypothetical protein
MSSVLDIVNFRYCDTAKVRSKHNLEIQILSFRDKTEENKCKGNHILD